MPRHSYSSFFNRPRWSYGGFGRWRTNYDRFGYLGLGGNRYGRSNRYGYSDDYYGRRPNFINYGFGGRSSDNSSVDTTPTSGLDTGPTVTPKVKPQVQEELSVTSVNFMVADNVAKHHTSEYDITEGLNPKLVVRRGQEFTIQVDFSRAYDRNKDDLRLVFEIGDNPKACNGTSVNFILSDKDEPGKWGAKISKRQGKSLVLAIFTPANCQVGKWDFKVDVVKRSDSSTSVSRYNHHSPIYMLFNAWCRADSVFMENALERDEYVLNDSGSIYVGCSSRPIPRAWVYGQFEGTVLDCCMYLIESSGLDEAKWGNPIRVVRRLTAMVNMQDDDGVLVGNWSGDYSDGKSPSSWTGSAAILEQYYKQKSPVEYGQCWVFSGVLTTVGRALGIPTRSVTNFSSAHDTNANTRIDIHVNADGDVLSGMNPDSIWNFHVWNEAWMARPDLPAGYGGWQACDATPQEESDDVYCCGPCSVRAIKEGNITLPYDGAFIFAEVNADRAIWRINADGTTECTRLDKNAVGKAISTTSLTGGREDVTNRYKYPEGSPEERAAVRNANKDVSDTDEVYKEGPQDVHFELVPGADPTLGEDFTLALRCTNTSSAVRSIYGRMSINTLYYTGVVGDPVATECFHNVMLQPAETKNVKVTASPDAYTSKLKDCRMLSLTAVANVCETKQFFIDKEDTMFDKPSLNIKAPARGKVADEIDVEVSFSNPLRVTLTDCSLEVEGPGLSSAKTYPQRDVKAKGTFFTTITLKPKKAGKRQIQMVFNSKQLNDIDGSHTVTVSKF